MITHTSVYHYWKKIISIPKLLLFLIYKEPVNKAIIVSIKEKVDHKVTFKYQKVLDDSYYLISTIMFTEVNYKLCVPHAKAENISSWHSGYLRIRQVGNLWKFEWFCVTSSPAWLKFYISKWLTSPEGVSFKCLIFYAIDQWADLELNIRIFSNCICLDFLSNQWPAQNTHPRRIPDEYTY